MTTTFESLSVGDTIDGPKFSVSRESIRLFCDGSLDYNPLHLDDNYMKGNFGKTNFGGIIINIVGKLDLVSADLFSFSTLTRSVWISMLAAALTSQMCSRIRGSRSSPLFLE